MLNLIKNFQDDISLASADIATKSTYRYTVYIMKNFLKNTLSPSTINRQVIKTRKKIKEFMKNKNKDDEEEYEHFYVMLLNHTAKKIDTKMIYT